MGDRRTLQRPSTKEHHLELFTDLLGMKNINLISLQKGKEADQLQGGDWEKVLQRIAEESIFFAKGS